MYVHVTRYSFIAFCVAIIILCWSRPRVYAQEVIQYPIVFDYGEKKKLNQLGLSFESDLRNKCYFYGEGGNAISVSDAVPQTLPKTRVFVEQPVPRTC